MSPKKSSETAAVRRQRPKYSDELGMRAPSLKRISRQGGVRTAKASTYDQARRGMRDAMKAIIFKSAVLLEHGKKSTITAKQAKSAIEYAMGHEFIGVEA